MEILLQPTLILLLDFTTLTSLQLVSKTVSELCENSPIGFWQALCRSLSAEFGLYTYAHSDNIFLQNAKKHFFGELWNCRKKWTANDEDIEQHQGFRVKVVCRMRPGEIGNEKMCLPLHQFLRVRRTQIKMKGEPDPTNAHLVGDDDPIEFLDPFLATLMKEPVKLMTSGRVVERTVAIQCILRNGRDPFNNQRLTAQLLEPQLDLAEKISAWRQKKLQSRDILMSVGEIKPLVDDNAVDPEILQALIDAERLESAATRAERDARGPSERADRDSQSWFPDSHVDDDQLEAILDTAGAAVAAEGYENPSVDPENISPQLALSSSTFYSGSDIDSTNGWAKPSAAARVVDVNQHKACVGMHINGTGVKTFHFSNVHGGTSDQVKVYEGSVRDSVVACMNGFNSTVLCYGQTGSGKTHTFFGPDGALDEHMPDCGHQNLPASTGVVVRSIAEMLSARDSMSKRGITVGISLQFVEIYDEQMTDLLTGAAVTVRRENGELVGGTEVYINCMDTAMATLRQGHARKRFAATAMNERSSRSHTVLVAKVSQTNPTVSDRLITSHLHLLDLAGSERVKKSKAEGSRLREAVGINSSLLVLGKVIAALVESKSHVPYYESKLTIVLKAAFGGNSRTTCVINCRAEDANGDETLQSMRFGERCCMISNSAKVAALSVTSALAALERALSTVAGQIAGLEARSKQHLESYKKLVHSHQLLQRQRIDLQSRVQA